MRKRSRWRLRQRIHALRLDRVLRREHQERRRHRVRDPADQHLTLPHDLEQSGLHLCGSPIDLIREGRSSRTLARAPHRTSPSTGGRRVRHDVGRDEVGRELDAGERATERLRQRGNRQRLAEAGHTLEQAVAAGEQADEHTLEDPFLTDDDAAESATSTCSRRAPASANAWARESTSLVSSCRRSRCFISTVVIHDLDLLCDRRHVGVDDERVAGDLHEQVVVDTTRRRR